MLKCSWVDSYYALKCQTMTALEIFALFMINKEICKNFCIPSSYVQILFVNIHSMCVEEIFDICLIADLLDSNFC